MTGDEAPEVENLIDLMNRLVEPPVPDPVSLAPQTAGWWVVGALVIAALAVGLWRGWVRWRANAYRRSALVELGAAQDPAAIAGILRRAALAAYPRREVAGLAGADWIAFLNATGGFPRSAGPGLVRAPYAPDGAGGEEPGLRQAAERWIRTHRRTP